MKPWLPSLFGALGALAACADYYPPPPPPAVPPPPVAAADAPADACFRTRDIDNHRVADPRTLYIRVANRDIFRIETSAACLSGAGPNDPLVIREATGTSLVCRPIDIDISIARGVGGSSPCIIQSLTRLTPDEVAALPDRIRP